jgi:hypothetical protein
LTLQILSDVDARDIFSSRLRKQDGNLSKETILSVWEKIVEKARRVLDIDLVGPDDPDGLKEIIYRLIAKAFPYN